MNYIYKYLKQIYKSKDKMFSQKKIQQFTLQNYHWLIAIFIYQFIIHITMMSYTEINNIYIKLGLVFVYSILSWAFSTLIYFMIVAGNNLEKNPTIINTGNTGNYDAHFNLDDIK